MFGTQNYFWPKPLILFLRTFLWTQNISGNNNISGHNIFYDQNVVQPKFIWIQKNLDHQFNPYQIFGTKLCLDPKLFGLNKNVDQQFHPNQIFHLTKKKYCTQTKIFWPEMLFEELKENSSVALLSSTCFYFHLKNPKNPGGWRPWYWNQISPALF